MKKFFILSLIIICSSCSRTKLLYEQDGEEIYRTLCGGSFQDMSNCYEYAFDTCKSDFIPIDIYNEDLLQTNTININNSINISQYPVNKNSPFDSFMKGYDGQKKRYLIFKCKRG